MLRQTRLRPTSVGQIQMAYNEVKPFEFLAATRQGRANVALRRDSSLRRCFRQSLHMFRSCACLLHASIRRELNLSEVTFLLGSGTMSPCPPRRGRRRIEGRPNVALRRDSSLRRCFRQRLRMFRSCECLRHASPRREQRQSSLVNARQKAKKHIRACSLVSKTLPMNS